MTTPIFLVWRYDYEQSQVVAVYASRELAELHVQREGEHYGIEEDVLRTEEPEWKPYYHGMAEVGRSDATLDRAPFVEERGPAFDFEPGPRVGTGPGRDWLSDSSIWLSVFALNRDEAMRLVTEKYDALRERREREDLPKWSNLIYEEYATPSDPPLS